MTIQTAFALFIITALSIGVIAWAALIHEILTYKGNK